MPGRREASAAACRAWAKPDGGMPLRCRLDLVPRPGGGHAPHAGDHRADGWTWRTGEAPTRPEEGLPRPADPADLPALCAELAALARGLDAALPRAVRPDRSQTRRVPAAQPPLDVDVLEAGARVTAGVAALARDLRAALGQARGRNTIDEALAAIPPLVEAVDAAHPLRGRVPFVLGALCAVARSVLDPDPDWLDLGPCPTRDEPVDVMTRDGLVEADTGCWTPDRTATAAAAARGDDAQIWRRSRIGIRRGDVESRAIVCRACGYTCTPVDRAPDLLVANGTGFRAGLTRIARVLGVPVGTLHRWRHEELIVPVEGTAPPEYDALAVARVVVARRAASPLAS